jgi:hypothetical protein
MDATVTVCGTCFAGVLERRTDLLCRDPAAAEPAGAGDERASLAARHTGGGGRAAGRGRVYEVVDCGGGTYPSRKRGCRGVPAGAVGSAAPPAPA